MTSIGGWGDYSIQPFSLNGTEFYPFGVVGSTPNITDADEAFDINLNDHSTRFAVVMVMNSDFAMADNSYTGGDIASGELSIDALVLENGFNPTNFDFTPPKNAGDQ